VHEDALGKSRERNVGDDNLLIRRAIAYYQSAAHGFSQGLLAWRPEAEGVVGSP